MGHLIPIPHPHTKSTSPQPSTENLLAKNAHVLDFMVLDAFFCWDHQRMVINQILSNKTMIATIIQLYN